MTEFIIALLAVYAVWSAQKIMRLSAVLHILVRMRNYSPIDSSNLHQGDYFPAYLGNMQKVFHIFSE